MFVLLVEEEHPACLKAKISEVFKSHQSATVKGILFRCYIGLQVKLYKSLNWHLDTKCIISLAYNY